MSTYSCPPKIYKYMSYNGLQKTLEDASFRLSKPAHLNDPIDMFVQEILGSDDIKFFQALSTVFFDFVSGDIDYSKLRNSASGVGARILNEILRTVPAAIKEDMRLELISSPKEDNYDIDSFRISVKEMIEHLSSELKTSGVFCSTVNYNNLLMWAHYADQHRGAVVEFSPSLEKDSPFLASKEILYSTVRPLLYRDPSALVMHALTVSEQDAVTRMFDELLYTKSTDWAYEREYRLCIMNCIPDDVEYKTLTFYPEELTAMYLGCRMDHDHKRFAASLARKLNPNINMYEACVAPREFGLEFLPSNIR